MATIFFFSSQERVPGPSVPDYVAHFIAYSFLAAAFYYPLQKTHGSGMKTVFIVLALTSLYGLSDEIHQSFVPGRISSAKDWAVDSLAGIVVPVVWNRLIKMKTE